MAKFKYKGPIIAWSSNLTRTNKKIYLYNTTSISTITFKTSTYNNSAVFSASAGRKVFISYAGDSRNKAAIVTSNQLDPMMYDFLIFAADTNSTNATIHPLPDTTPATVNGLEGYIFTVPEGCSYIWIAGMANSSNKVVTNITSTQYRGTVTNTWSDTDNFHLLDVSDWGAGSLHKFNGTSWD